MTAEEAKGYAEEALIHARRVGDREHEARLLGGYGRIMAAAGTADDYVRLVREALAVTDAGANPESDLLLNGLLCQAWSRAGLPREALDANDAALAAIDAAAGPESGTALALSVRQMVGFDVAHWVRCLRASVLIALGRFEEAELWLARLMQTEEAGSEPIIQYIPHFAAVELAWLRGDVVAAKWHASEVARYARQSAVPFVLVKSLICQGMSAFIGGDFPAAESVFRAALATARQGGAGLDYEARLLALLTETYVRAGEAERAVHTLTEATEAALRRTDRFSECHAAVAGAMALASSGRTDRLRKAAELLGRADELIAITGAVIFQPLLEQARLLVDTGKRSWS
jgi:adenylate cyclase